MLYILNLYNVTWQIYAIKRRKNTPFSEADQSISTSMIFISTMFLESN